MIIKKKHLMVIFFSSAIITVVLVSTLLGYSLYIQWKEDSFALKYTNSIYKMTAEMFSKDIVVSNASVKIGGDESFPGMPVLEGSLKNNSSKTVTSIMIELSFVKPDGTVVYRDWFYPLRMKQSARSATFPGAETSNVLLPGEGMSFRHLLRNCPNELVSQLTRSAKFAKMQTGEIRFEYSIAGLSVS